MTEVCKCKLLSHIHANIKVRMITKPNRYDIILTTSFFFIFSNVLLYDKTKKCSKILSFVTNILENFQNKDGGGAFLSKARSLSFEHFS